MGEVFKLNHCYNVDCVPAMELFPDNYFDLAVVDPPYFSGPERRGFYGSKVSKIPNCWDTAKNPSSASSNGFT